MDGKKVNTINCIAWNCYVPAAKRQFGYFSLPVLWDGRLAARMDCNADRETEVLHIHHLALEP